MNGAATASARHAEPYADPYVAGVALGLVLLAAYVLVGRGLGASGAFATAGAAVVGSGSAFFTEHRAPNGLLSDWLVVELLGVVAGGALSAWLAGRVYLDVERGPRVTSRARLGLALGGGAVMGAGAVFARGCTSGQALSGGALLSVGSWLFVAGAFAAAYATARLARRVWT